jgi:hypothetical protein
MKASLPSPAQMKKIPRNNNTSFILTTAKRCDMIVDARGFRPSHLASLIYHLIDDDQKRSYQQVYQ